MKLLLWLKNIWSKRKKTIIQICLFLGILVVAFIAGKCSTRQERQHQISNLVAARDSIKHYVVTVDGLSQQVYEKNAVILSQADAIAAGFVREEALKKLHIKDLVTSAQLQATITRQDSLLSLPPKTEYLTIKDSSGIKKNYVRYPFTLLNEHDKYLSLDAGLDSLKQAWFKLKTPFSGAINIGYKRTGFLKTTPVGVFSTDNQYLTVNQMDIVIVPPSKKIYDRWWVHSAVGVGVWEGLRKILTGHF